MKKEKKIEYHRKWNNRFYQLRKRFYCFILNHKWTPHYTGKKIQIGKDAPIGYEVDYYYCERCEIKDPERCDYPEEERKKLAQFYVSF